MTTLYVLFSILAISVVYLLYTSKAYRGLKAAALVLLTVFGLTVHEHYVSALGAPLQGVPEGEFVYVHHQIAGDTIELWVWTEERGNRLYEIPYSQETAEELEKAKQKNEGGTPQQGEFPPTDGKTASPPAPKFDDWQPKGDQFDKG